MSDLSYLILHGTAGNTDVLYGYAGVLLAPHATDELKVFDPEDDEIDFLVTLIGEARQRSRCLRLHREVA